jgi:hypothetical protein
LVLIADPDAAIIERFEFFDPEDADPALTRFEELTQESQDPVERLARALTSAFVTRQWQPVANLLSPDVVAEDHRRVVGRGRVPGREASMASFKTIAEVGARRVDVRRLASRGPRLELHHALFRGSEGEEVAALTVFEFDAAGLLRSYDVFDEDDLDAAYDELDARYMAGEGAPFAESLTCWRQVLTATNSGDNAAVLSSLSPDLVAVFRGSLMAPPLDREGYVAAIAEGRKLVPDRCIRVMEMLRVRRSGAVAALESSGHDLEGGAIVWKSVLVVIAHPETALIERIEFFDPEDVDAALARFEELTAGPEDPGQRFERTVNAAFRTGDWAALTALYHPRAVLEDRRSVVGGGRQIRGPGAIVREIAAAREVGATEVVTGTLATRGGLLRLHHHTYRGTAGELSAVAVSELDSEGSIRAVVMFDDVDLEAAYDELAARYLAGEGAPFADSLARWTRLMDAAGVGDDAAVLSMLSDNFVAVFPTRSMTPSLDGLGFVALLAEGRTLVPDVRVRVTELLRISRFSALAAIEGSGHDREGGAMVRPSLAVLVEHPDRHLIERVEFLDPEDIDAAIARFEELTAEPPDPGERYAREVTSALVSGNWEPVADLMRPDVVIEDHRRVVGGIRFEGRDDNLSALKAIAELGGRALETHLLASRGGRLALHYNVFSGLPGEVPTLTVRELDAEGLLRRTDVFDEDDLGAAVALLDQRYAEGEAAPHAARPSTGTMWRAWCRCSRMRSQSWIARHSGSSATLTRTCWGVC